MKKRDKPKVKAPMKADASYVDAEGEARELDAAFFEGAEFGIPDLKPFEKMRRGRPELPAEKRKQKVTIMLDRDIVDHFKKDGKGWQTRLNAALRQSLVTEQPVSLDVEVAIKVLDQTLFAVLPADRGQPIKFVSKSAGPLHLTMPHTVARRLVNDDVSVIRAWREHLGLTQQQVAERLGISQAAFAQKEQASANLKPKTLKAIAGVLGISEAQLDV